MKTPFTLGNPINEKSLQGFVEQTAKRLAGNIGFGSSTSNTTATSGQDQNIQCSKASGVTPGTANVEFAVTHYLPYVPTNFIVNAQAAGSFYQSTTPWTAATPSTPGTIYLKCSAASVPYFIIIL